MKLYKISRLISQTMLLSVPGIKTMTKNDMRRKISESVAYGVEEQENKIGEDLEISMMFFASNYNEINDIVIKLRQIRQTTDLNVIRKITDEIHEIIMYK